MDSRKIVNDIVNKRFSKARDAIREELVNRIVTKVESMTPEVINEKLGLLKKAKIPLAISALEITFRLTLFEIKNDVTFSKFLSSFFIPGDQHEVH